MKIGHFKIEAFLRPNYARSVQSRSVPKIVVIQLALEQQLSAEECSSAVSDDRSTNLDIFIQFRNLRMKLTSLALMTGIAVSGIAASSVFAPALAGTLLTSQAGYTGPVLDLSGQANGQYNYTLGPVVLPNGITFTSNATGTYYSTINPNELEGSVLGQGYYELGDGATDPNGNGYFDLPSVYAGLDGDGGYMTFSFANPVQSFGAFVNYAPGFGGNPVISTYNGNTLLSSFDLSALAPISSPGAGNYFEFRGISEDTASITSFRLGGGYILASDSNDFYIAPEAVPEPFTIVGTLVGGSAALRMRKKLKSSTKK